MINLLQNKNYIHPNLGWVRVTKVYKKLKLFSVKHISQPHKNANNILYNIGGLEHSELKEYNPSKVN